MNIEESTIEIVKKCQDKNGSIFGYDPIEGVRKAVLSEIINGMSAATSTISYKYDAFNRRIEKDVNGTITRYVYDRGNIHLEYDGENTFQAKYVHSDNVDEPLRMERPDNPYKNAKFPVQEFYYHRDRLGNITEITDFEGTVVQRYVYDAFGKVSIFDKDGNAITPDSAKYLKSPYAFTGQEYDYETGMFLHGVRYYDPDSGRFISEEPLGLDGPNLYWYTLNNPMNYVDPTGLLTRGVGFGVGAGFFGAGGTANVQYVWDDKGNWNIAVTRCNGGVTEAVGANLGISASSGTGATINDLEGASGSSGVVVNPALSLSPKLGLAAGVSVGVSEPIHDESSPCMGKKRRAINVTGFVGGALGYSPVDVDASGCFTEFILD